MATSASCRIGIDTLGSETPTVEIIQGSLDFARKQEDCVLTFVGREDELKCVKEFGHQVVACSESVNQHDSLMNTLRSNRQSSMKMALQLIARGEVDGVVSTGDTAALMALSRQVLPMLEHIDRPAIIKRFDGRLLPYWMLDLGANIARKISLLIQFAHMGSAYAKAVGKVSQPRVSILNIGSEARKGPQMLRDAAELLSREAGLYFVGYVEADRLFEGMADVVIADGFSGNIALKSIEGATGIAHHIIQQELQEAGLQDSELATEVAFRVQSKLNAQAYNGASLVGLNGIVVKSHGRTDRVGIGAALGLAKQEVDANVPVQLHEHYRLTRQ